MKKLVLLLLLVLTLNPSKTIAFENTNCPDRYVTLVNPVRSRELWVDRSMKPIDDQYNAVSSRQLAATWLLQYDAIKDNELSGKIKHFDNTQELGVLLEVSKNLAVDARVAFDGKAQWYQPNVVFLSAYSQSERRKIIDKLFNDFKGKFGYFPKSVGSWWIDSYSLGYMQDKYDIKAAMIVADQLTTDHYGVWGQWWGVPYYPSKLNILAPASSTTNKVDIPVIQWAQRDPLRSVGESPKYSNHSLQANDYKSLGYDTSYFEQIAGIYLDCSRKIGQITVGMETGMEGFYFHDEYIKQLDKLLSAKSIQSITMSNFADEYRRVYPMFPEIEKASYEGSEWNMNTSSRSNQKFGEKITYRQDLTFKDFYLADKDSFLDRKLKIDKRKGDSGVPLFMIAAIIFGIYVLKTNRPKIWIYTLLFSFGAFGQLLFSKIEHGWIIFYSVQLKHLQYIQPLLFIIPFMLFLLGDRVKFFDKKFKEHFFWVLPLSFGVEVLLTSLRFTVIDGKYLLGFFTDAYRMVGIEFSKPFEIGILSKDFSPDVSSAFLSLKFLSNIHESPLLYFFVIPAAHVVASGLLSLLMTRLDKRVNLALYVSMTLLFIWHAIHIFQSDPRSVLPYF